uniref:Bm13129, isoform c n=1 Tax=Brugia malayi TaxID=6279 RepID=A0A1I9G3D0_BRUMA|nr:Bm13129, isoform c [Brugia malayi]
MQADSPIHGDSAKYPRLRIEIYPCILRSSLTIIISCGLTNSNPFNILWFD